MKKWMIFALLLTLSFSSCNGQKDKKGTKPDLKPNENVIVNKEYDENGNLIRYDSTYTYFYSNIDSDKVRDSILKNFKEQFNQQFWFSDEPFFDDFFFNDSLMQRDFYTNDFFTKRFQKDMQKMEQLFREMDSIKNQFYQGQFPVKKGKLRGSI